jgi:putative ABC transport system permease protein
VGILSRAIRNVFRKKVRSIFVILIIGFCLGIFITMSIVNANISDRAANISANAATQITIRPAGEYGGFRPSQGSMAAMNESIIPKIKSVTHISAVQTVITQREGEMTPPSEGTRPRMTMVQGEDPRQPLILMGGGTLTITSTTPSGRTLNSGDANAMVAIIGTGYSTEKSASVGGMITLNGTSIKVVGIFTTGNQFGDNGIIIPYETAKKVYAISGMNTVYVTVDYAGNVDYVVSTLKSVLGSDYDVVSASSMQSNIQNSINTIYQNSATGLYIALITGVAVMIFIMILVTRERTKEIGVLKAIGFKNSSIVSQFFIESIFLAIFGFIVAIILVMAAGPSLANMVLGTTSGSSGGPGSRFGGPPGEMGGSFASRIEFNLQPELVMFTLILAIILGIIGSLYPIIKAVHLKPAEALRYE